MLVSFQQQKLLHSRACNKLLLFTDVRIGEAFQEEIERMRRSRERRSDSGTDREP